MAYTPPTAPPAIASNSNPQYVEGASASPSQTLSGRSRIQDDDQITVAYFLAQILVELRVQNALLHQTLNSRDQLDVLRRESLNTLTD